MAKARSRAAARKIKDRWKSKNWYNILAPASFDNVTVADTLSNSPEKLINRVTEVSLQDLTNDFRKSHIKLFFKINNVKENNAHTQFVGHTLTSDYSRRLIRRKKSKIDGVYDVSTRDGAKIRVKPFATTDKRIQNSQKKIIRDVMKKTLTKQAKNLTMSEFIKKIIDGDMGRDIYKNSKSLYPVKRVEIFKTEVLNQPTIEIKEPKPKKEPKPEDKKEKQSEDKGDTEEKKEKDEETEDKKESSKKKETSEEEKPAEKKPEEKPKKKETKKKAAKKTTKKSSKKKKTKKSEKENKDKTEKKEDKE